MKTALQELIHELQQFKKYHMVDPRTIDAVIELAELKLEPERLQLENAYKQGVIDEVGEIIDTTTIECTYYEDTFGKGDM